MQATPQQDAPPEFSLGAAAFDFPPSEECSGHQYSQAESVDAWRELFAQEHADGQVRTV